MGKPNNSIGHVQLPGESVQRPIVPQQLWDGTTNYAASLPTLTEDSKILLSAVSVTYAQLGTLMNNNQLLAGAFYRIIDFVTTTAQARTRSAGHQFDLIVHAISSNELSEDANAVLHAGDTYFANSNLKAWVIKYKYNNDVDRYAWADTVNGKGVIYYMKDEFHNECGYDFKNIQFARYKITACANAPALVGHYYGAIHHTTGDVILSSYMSIDSTDYQYYYTFDCLQTDFSMNAVGTTLTRPDGSTFTLNQIQCTKCLVCPDENDSSKFYLNNFVALLETNRDCMFKLKGWSQNTTFLGGCSNADVYDIYGSLVGTLPGSFIDGYAIGTCTIGTISNSLICSSGASYALYSSLIEGIYNSCLVCGNSGCFRASSMNVLSGCTLLATDATSGLIRQSSIGSMSACTITARYVIVYRCNIGVIANCIGTAGIDYYFQNCTGAYIYNVSSNDSTLNSSFIANTTFDQLYNCSLARLAQSNISYLRDCTLKKVIGCSFIFSQGLTCAQDLKGCNFAAGVDYLQISSTDTAQTITSTNFHDIRGTDLNNLKNVIIPEDYTDLHTVDIYSSNQYVIHEID